ncbi:MAG: GGDEF domain-containing protein [Janthinobacterium lividum]
MLDPVNILIVIMISSMMSMAILGSLRSAAIPGVGRWITANALSVVALIFFTLQRVVPLAISVVAANELLAIAVVLMLQGCRQFFGCAPSNMAEYVGCMLVLLSIIYWTYVSPDIHARIVIVSEFHAYIYASVGWITWRQHTPGRPTYSYRFMCVAAWLGAFGHASRGFAYAVGWAQQTALLQSAPLNVAFLALAILALPSLSIGMVMLSHDRMAERLERWANFDELTGALTRRAFLAKAATMLEEVTGPYMKSSIAIVDIDHFKFFNDHYGHAAGDWVLAQFGRLMVENTRAMDIVGRLGGEEFAILFPATSRDNAFAWVDRLRTKTPDARQQIGADGSENGGQGNLRFTFSAGVAEHHDGESLVSLMARADSALYSAKALGRNRVVSA